MTIRALANGRCLLQLVDDPCTQGANQRCWEGNPTLCRCRHAVAAVGPYVFIYGGLKGSTLLDDFLLADDSSGAEMSICDPRSPTWRQWLDSAHGSVGAAAMLAENAAEEAAAAAAMGVRRVGAVEDLRCLDEHLRRRLPGGLQNLPKTQQRYSWPHQCSRSNLHMSSAWNWAVPQCSGAMWRPGALSSL